MHGSEERLDWRVRYRRNERRLGLGGNWNAVAREAAGTYLVIIGDDDRLLPNFVETLLAARGTDTAVLFSNHHMIGADGARRDDLTLQALVDYARDVLPAGPVQDPAAYVWRNSVPMLASLIRTSDVRRLGIKTDLNTPEIELFARLAAEGKEFVFVPEYLAEYRVHELSETAVGLAPERLLKYLDPIEVPASAEGAKRAFMVALLVSAVNRALREGNVALARTFIANRFYPALRVRPTVVASQRLLACLPGALARRGMNLATRVRRELRSTTPSRPRHETSTSEPRSEHGSDRGDARRQC